MFYPIKHKEVERPVFALFCLTPSESKRLIAKGVANLPEVKKALKEGMLIIARGTTNAYVAEEILGISIEKFRYAVGVITKGQLNATSPEIRMKPFVIKQGKVVDMEFSEALKGIKAGDVFIKGANAIDIEGNAGILVAGERGGTWGEAFPFVVPRGAHLIVPAGLEKIIPSVVEAGAKTGIFRFKYSTGVPATLIPLVNAKVLTEIQALGILAGVKATHIASGGIGGSEGSVVLSLEGDEEGIERALSLIKQIKGEAPIPSPPTICPPAHSLNYDALIQWQTLQTH